MSIMNELSIMAQNIIKDLKGYSKPEQQMIIKNVISNLKLNVK